MILYVIEFSKGLFKVGTTTQPFNKRKQQIAYTKKRYSLLRAFHCETDLKELKLIHFCKKNGRHAGFGNEWFYGLEFEKVVEFLLKHKSWKEPEPKYNVQQELEPKGKITRKELKPKDLNRLTKKEELKQIEKELEPFNSYTKLT